ncbi:MAG: alpha/beta fold hydrolase [Candidatus Kuenenbacteria bacterium]
MKIFNNNKLILIALPIVLVILLAIFINANARSVSVQKQNSCNDKIWNIGEDINNCSQDANKYSIPPSDTINVSDTNGYTVGMYIYPSWHGEPKVLKDLWKPIMNAKAIYPGQEQPKKPITNYYDDANPVVADWMIKWSLENNVNLFVYDWYNWQPSNAPINVFLKELNGKYATYKDKIKFALLWANHDEVPAPAALQAVVNFLKGKNYTDEQINLINKEFIQPCVNNSKFDICVLNKQKQFCQKSVNVNTLYCFAKFKQDITDAYNIYIKNLLPAKEDYVLKVLDNAADKYFGRDEYYKIDNKPVFIIFDPSKLINAFGDNGTNELFKKMKARMVTKGYNGLYIILNSECNYENTKLFAFDAATAYNYAGKVKMPVDTYDNYIKKHSEIWNKVYNKCQTLKNLDKKSINYFLSVGTGWDNTPWKDRTYNSIITNSTPAKFKTLLTNAKNFIDKKNIASKIVIINAWDEWGEGAVLAPRADKWGFGYLEAVKDVFGKLSSAKCSSTTYSEISFSNNRKAYCQVPTTGSNFPLIIVLHGGGQNALDWFENNNSKGQVEFVKKALSKGYAVIAPDSETPNYSNCTKNTKQWYYEKDWQNSSDYTFFNEIIPWINNQNIFNSNRVYATGISSGGFMSSRLARFFGTPKIKAIAVRSAGDADSITHKDRSDMKLCSYGNNTFPKSCGPIFNDVNLLINTNHSPTLIIHGSKDGTVPIESANHYYDELISAKIAITKKVKLFGCHTWFNAWLNDYDQEILNWFDKYK